MALSPCGAGFSPRSPFPGVWRGASANAFGTTLETRERIRMDCERAQPGHTDQRPTVFDAQQTQVFGR